MIVKLAKGAGVINLFQEKVQSQNFPPLVFIALPLILLINS
jgi:hypothetical protein